VGTQNKYNYDDERSRWASIGINVNSNIKKKIINTTFENLLKYVI